MIVSRLELYRDMSMALLRMESEGVNILDHLKFSKVYLYGTGVISKYIVSKSSDYCRIKGIIEKVNISENNSIKESLKSSGYENDDFLVITEIDELKPIIEELELNNKNRFYTVSQLIFLSDLYLFQKQYKNKSIDIFRDLALFRNEIRIDNIMITGTPYTLMLLFLYVSDWDNCLYIIDGKYSRDIVTRMQERNLRVLNTNGNDTLPVYQAALNLARLIGVNHSIYKRKINVFGQDHLLAARYFIDDNFCVVEDGVANYEFEEMKKFSFLIRDGMYVPGGFSDLIEKVILTGSGTVPELIRRKVDIINIRDKWEELPEEKKRDLLYFFGIDTKVTEHFSDTDDVVIFASECFSDDGFMTRDQEIRLYQKIVSNHLDKKILIKPHPRSLIRFGELFGNYYVLPNVFPIELLFLMNIKIDGLIGINTSSIFGNCFVKCEKYVYDTDGSLIREYV